MAQNQSVNLSVAGEYTSGNDMNGLPQGALDFASNVESRYRNVLEPRRGFDNLTDSVLGGSKFIRLQNFFVGGTDSIVALTDLGNLLYYNVSDLPTPWDALPGSVVSNILPPDSVNGKSRFVKGGQNLYVTAQDGVRSLASGSGSNTLRAGVPKALDLEATTNGDTLGFFSNNLFLTTTGNISNGQATVKFLADSTNVAVGNYVTGTMVLAHLVVQDLTYTSVLFGASGNAITIAYTTGGTAGAEVVSVVSHAISVQIQSGVSTATQIRTAVMASGLASALVTVTVSGTGSNAQTAPVAATHLAGGLDNTIPVGTKVLSIQDQAAVIVENGDVTAGSTSIASLASNAGIVPGLLITGLGIPDGTTVVSITGGPSPYTVTASLASFETATGTPITFIAPEGITMTQDAVATLNGTPISFYTGAQVAYRILYGRVENDINNANITRLGTPSVIANCTNISPYSTDVVLTATLPKNSSSEIQFVQLYRSLQTPSDTVSPLDQYGLVYERQLTGTDFSNRTITITDTVPDSLRGLALYSGSDQEGILQTNDPPPSCWDMCTFRDFALYGNITQPSTLDFTILSVGAPNGVQIGDQITITGSFVGTPFTGTYTGAASENAAAGQFAIITTGTPSQNITDTANSLIRVINYDQSTPVHAILVSSTNDLPGQILLESDNPSYDLFTVTASAHTSAYDPTLSSVSSLRNGINNGIAVSKSGELEAVPISNIVYAGDSSANILRMIPLRDYIVVLKTDGVYKIQGLTPSTLTSSPFDLTTKIIGADTAVSLNSAVWMLSNQGVVSISDGGVDAKSIPIDDQLNSLIQTFQDNVKAVAFSVGYESDRKLILAVPNGSNLFTETQHIYNYITNTWTRWERNLLTGFVHSNQNKLYVTRAETGDQGVSSERKTGTYRDYVDEPFDVTISSIVGSVITLSDVTGVIAGDILFQGSNTFSPILAVNAAANTVTVQTSLGWTPGAAQVLSAFKCEITWKQVFGDNPAFVRQFSEGIALFKNTNFNVATMSFQTDFSSSIDSTTLSGSGNGLWGLFGWGMVPWGGLNFPQNLRFYIPQNKQLGSYIIPTLTIQQGYSNFKFQGLSISHSAVSQEVGV